MHSVTIKLPKAQYIIISNNTSYVCMLATYVYIIMLISRVSYCAKNVSLYPIAVVCDTKGS